MRRASGKKQANKKKNKSTALFFDSSVNKYNYILMFRRWTEDIETVSGIREEEVSWSNATAQLNVYNVDGHCKKCISSLTVIVRKKKRLWCFTVYILLNRMHYIMAYCTVFKYKRKYRDISNYADHAFKLTWIGHHLLCSQLFCIRNCMSVSIKCQVKIHVNISVWLCSALNFLLFFFLLQL